MSKEITIKNLKFARKEYIFHKSNDREYPLKRALIDFFAKECLKYRQLLENQKWYMQMDTTATIVRLLRLKLKNDKSRSSEFSWLWFNYD